MLVAGHGPSKRTALSVRLRGGLLGVERKRPEGSSPTCTNAEG